MPTYYFHIQDLEDHLIDPDGTHLPNDRTAEMEAVTAVGTMISDMADETWAGRKWTMQVVREDGQQVFDFTLIGKRH